MPPPTKTRADNDEDDKEKGNDDKPVTKKDFRRETCMAPAIHT